MIKRSSPLHFANAAVRRLAFYYAAPARQCHLCNAAHSCRYHRLASVLLPVTRYLSSLPRLIRASYNFSRQKLLDLMSSPKSSSTLRNYSNSSMTEFTSMLASFLMISGLYPTNSSFLAFLIFCWINS